MIKNGVVVLHKTSCYCENDDFMTSAVEKWKKVEVLLEKTDFCFGQTL